MPRPSASPGLAAGLGALVWSKVTRAYYTCLLEDGQCCRITHLLTLKTQAR